MIISYNSTKCRELGLSAVSVILGVALDNKRMMLEKVKSLQLLSSELVIPPASITKGFKELESMGFAIKTDGFFTTTKEWIDAYYGTEQTKVVDKAEEMTRFIENKIREFKGKKPHPDTKKIALAKVHMIKKIMTERYSRTEKSSAFELKKIQFEMILKAYKHWVGDPQFDMYYTIENMFSSVIKFDKKLAAAREKFKK